MSRPEVEEYVAGKVAAAVAAEREACLARIRDLNLSDKPGCSFRLSEISGSITVLDNRQRKAERECPISGESVIGGILLDAAHLLARH